MNKYVITFSHLLKVLNGKPQFIISACHISAGTSFGARLRFFKTHNAKKDKILSIEIRY